MRALILSLLAAVSLASISDAQSPTPAPVVVPAMTPATTAKGPVAANNAASSTRAALTALQAVKAANEEILRQQAATLQKLDEIEKAANEIRIYSKRG
jgi:hypothetical protein